jgi:predicted transcriptional regulator
MTTTTLRLPADLKQRLDKLAKSSGTSIHSLMVDAIAQKADELELRAAFHAEADSRLEDLLAHGAGLDWHDMRSYLAARVKGKKPKAPKVRKWRV